MVDEAVIVGGGIGGLATAICLHKLGIRVTVYEKSSAEDRLSERGTLVTLQPNGLKALHAIDPSIVLKLKEFGAELPRMMKVTTSGEISSDIVRTDMVGMAFQWSRILDTLVEFLPPSCIQTGYMCTALTEVDDGVEVTVVKDGETTIVKSQLVVGADGVNSVVRNYVLKDNPVGARDLGRRLWRALVPSFTPLDIPENTTMWSMTEGRSAVVATMGPDWIYWALAAFDAFGGAERSASPDEMKARVKELFPHWDLLQSVIEATSAESIVERRILDMPELPTWSRGRVVLIGDSAHAIPPAMGQGANMAIEDALELGRQLLSSTSVEEALANYFTEREPRMKFIADMNNASVRAAYSMKQAQDPTTSGTELIVDYPRLLEPLLKTQEG